MNAVLWRLHRQQACLAGAALAALAALFLISGLKISHDYSSFLANCAVAHACADTGAALGGDRLIIDLGYATMAAPALLGLFWGAPLLAGEFEAGTHQLSWTQGVTRRRWLAATVTGVLLAAALWAGFLALLVSWWRGPENALGIPGVRLGIGTFDVQGIVPVTYAVFAVALGIAAGSIFRRVLPAMAATLATFTGIRFLTAIYLRPRYLSPYSVQVSLSARGLAPPGSWVLSSTTAGPNGRDYGNGIPIDAIPAACRALDVGRLTTCLASHGIHLVVTYQPAGRFWIFQSIEAGGFLVLTAAMLAVACRAVLRRDA